MRGENLYGFADVLHLDGGHLLEFLLVEIVAGGDAVSLLTIGAL